MFACICFFKKSCNSGIALNAKFFNWSMWTHDRLWIHLEHKKDLSAPNISTGIIQGIFRSFCVFGNSISQHTASKLLVLTMTHILVPLVTAIWLPRGQIGVYYWWNSITRLILITAFSQLLNQRPPRAL